MIIQFIKIFFPDHSLVAITILNLFFFFFRRHHSKMLLMKSLICEIWFFHMGSSTYSLKNEKSKYQNHIIFQPMYLIPYNWRVTITTSVYHNYGWDVSTFIIILRLNSIRMGCKTCILHHLISDCHISILLKIQYILPHLITSR